METIFGKKQDHFNEKSKIIVMLKLQSREIMIWKKIGEKDEHNIIFREEYKVTQETHRQKKLRKLWNSFCLRCFMSHFMEQLFNT